MPRLTSDLETGDHLISVGLTESQTPDDPTIKSDMTSLNGLALAKGPVQVLTKGGSVEIEQDLHAVREAFPKVRRVYVIGPPPAIANWTQINFEIVAVEEMSQGR